MRKYLLPVMALCLGLTTSAKAETTDLSSYSHVIYVESSSLSIGTSGYLSISMKNEDKSIEGFSFTLQLPEGITPNGTPTLSSNRSASKSFSFPTDPNVSGQDINFVASPKTESGLGVGDGEIILVPVTVSADVSGNLTVVVKDIKMGYTDTENKQQYAFNDETVEIKTDIAMTSDVIINENWTQAPAKANGVNVTVYRSLNAGVWSTICLPFAMTDDQMKEAFGDSYQLADFTGCQVQQDGETVTGIKVNFESVTSGITANHPYIIKTSKAVSEFRVENVNVLKKSNPTVDDGEGNEMRGNYIAGTAVEEDGIFLSGGNFWYSNGNTSIKGCRAYFYFNEVLTDKAKAATRAFISVDGDGTTGIKASELHPAITGKIYSLSGQDKGEDMESLQKGIYIVNGKKVVKK